MQTPNSDPLLECRQLRKTFGSHTALDSIDLQVHPGECQVLLGPSGCGKTTLLNLVAGSLAADGGTLSIAGTVMDDPARSIHQPMQTRGLAMVFQNHSLWPHMNVEQNVGFGLKLRGTTSSQRRRQVMEILERLQIAEFADRAISTLSGGQQQRVAIARALVVRPRLLLMDEPLSALDARLKEELKSEIALLIRDTGQTVVYVTHDQGEAFALGDRIALMADGRIAQNSTPEAIYQSPSNRFVAEFIGSANILAFERRGDEIVLDNALRLAATNGLPANGHLVVRREDIDLSPGKAPPPDARPNGVLPGSVRHSRFLGDRHEILLDLDQGMRLRAFHRSALACGETVGISLDLQRAHVVRN
ncbi:MULTISPECIES: ABC transporter ATP-binding protein [unclassified Thioalkalivibrio]|uniref:ABC transporter ATP-binding protein n=1 Tax=unclassified Thioalkalivibrio TaxID=2621013 RepID=UPI000366673F|nr:MULTISPECIES: ABC transporter ATP-binding protein [unclassified Thioalkalivibrio]